VLLCQRVAIEPGTTSGMLHDRLMERAPVLVLETLRDKPIPVRQADTGVEYAKKITKEEARIDWGQPVETIYQKILGLNPAPGAYFTYQGEMIKIWDASVSLSPTGKGIGTIIDDRLGIACRDGVLHPTLLQRPGKKRMAADEILRGFAIPAGARLE